MKSNDKTFSLKQSKQFYFSCLLCWLMNQKITFLFNFWPWFSYMYLKILSNVPTMKYYIYLNDFFKFLLLLCNMKTIVFFFSDIILFVLFWNSLYSKIVISDFQIHSHIYQIWSRNKFLVFFSNFKWHFEFAYSIFLYLNFQISNFISNNENLHKLKLS